MKPIHFDSRKMNCANSRSACNANSNADAPAQRAFQRTERMPLFLSRRAAATPTRFPTCSKLRKIVAGRTLRLIRAKAAIRKTVNSRREINRASKVPNRRTAAGNNKANKANRVSRANAAIKITSKLRKARAGKGKVNNHPTNKVKDNRASNKDSRVKTVNRASKDRGSKVNRVNR